MQFHSWYPGPFLWNSLASNQSQRDRHKRHVAKKHYSQFHRLSILTERLFVVQSSRILQKFRARIRNEDLLAQKSRAPEEFAGRIRCETTCTTRWNFLHERKLSPRKREREREREEGFSHSQPRITDRNFPKPARMDQNRRNFPTREKPSSSPGNVVGFSRTNMGGVERSCQRGWYDENEADEVSRCLACYVHAGVTCDLSILDRSASIEIPRRVHLSRE